jgi:hypothetical protein
VALGKQVHDFNPDTAPDGLFWTTLVPSDSVQVHLGDGTAKMSVSGLMLEDYFSLGNALSGGDGVPATVNYTIQWFGPTNRVRVGGATTSFAGKFVVNSATIAWSASRPATASTPEFTFKSDEAPTTSLFALIGHERNGAFLSQEDDGGDDSG